MPHEAALIATLATSLGVAFVFGLVAVRIGLPPVVGYLLAGIAVGPFTPGFVGDMKIAGQLAEIGVMLLMFGVGMHFPLSELMAIRRIALPGALLRMAVIAVLGAGVAAFWGWPLTSGLVFGLALAVASTVVLLRALETETDMGAEDRRLAIGWLVVEDLAMIVVLVLLPVTARLVGAGGAPVLGHESWSGALGLIALTIAKVAVFVAMMLVIGARLLPWLLNQVVRTGSRELFTLAVVASAIGIAFGAAKLFGVSFALGAFFAGVVVHASDHSNRAEADLQPLEDAFGVLFFVSVGMLFDPSILIRQPVEILTVLAIVLVGKSVVTFGLMRAFGHPPRAAALIAASLSQIGEFSFILAGLSVGLGLLPEEGRSLILAAALVSIAVNPVMFRVAKRWSRLPSETHTRQPVSD
ncbi:MAG TPA: cation:proton antiporter [Nitrospirales bacterium]|nr:cation:proton antiporter [Nitrospirales bacterium]